MTEELASVRLSFASSRDRALTNAAPDQMLAWHVLASPPVPLVAVL
jgi:hypothetical protein